MPPDRLLDAAWRAYRAGRLPLAAIHTLQAASMPRCATCRAPALASIDPTRRPLCAVCAGVAWVRRP